MRSLRYWAGEVTKGLGLCRSSKLCWGMANGYQQAQNINPSVGLRIMF